MQYAVLSETLEDAGADLPLSELHGGLCGLLCSAGAGAAASWLEELISARHCEAPDVGAGANELRALPLETWGKLAGSEMQFTPLIPEDDCALDERVEALAQWCNGFLSGLGLGGIALGKSAPDHVREIVDDLSEISRAGLSAEESDNEEETDFVLAELIEYVRVGVQIIFEELAGGRADSTGEGREH